jgi:adenylate kinase family enzyme
VVRERLRVYRRDTQPLVDYYRARPTFRALDGAQSPDRVAAALSTAVDEVGSGLVGSGQGPGR